MPVTEQPRTSMKAVRSWFRKLLLGFDVQTYFFGQTGEDAVLRSLFDSKLMRGEKGFYVDVGAYHPWDKSNTYLFYKAGWSGINIDARPGSMKLFGKHRPRDINLEVGISRKEGIETYHIISDDSPMNSFSRESLESLNMLRHVQRTVPVEVLPLSVVLSRHVPVGQHIDFLTVDVEGYDLEVLESNDWDVFRPSVILAETPGKYVEELREQPVSVMLRNHGSRLCARTLMGIGIGTGIYASELLLSDGGSN